MRNVLKKDRFRTLSHYLLEDTNSQVSGAVSLVRDVSKAVKPWNDLYRSLPINRPAGGVTPDGKSYEYTPNDCSVGDVDGDGEYEIILKWDPTNAHDNSHDG